MNKSKVISGVLIGAAAGAIISTLFATKKGASFRKMIADKSGHLGDMVLTQFSNMKNSAKKMMKKAKKKTAAARDPKYAM